MYKCGHLSGSVRVTSGGNKILPCCHVDVKKLGKSTQQSGSLDEFINNPLLVEMRESAANGQAHPLCNTCVYKEQHGIESERQTSFRWFNNKGFVKPIIDTNDIEMLYLTLSNVCNFKCVMCNPNDSHLIGKEYGHENPLKDTGEQFFDSIIELLKTSPNLHTIQISGGEPFYNKKRLAAIVEAAPRSAYIYMHTNGSIFDKQAQDIVKQMEEFRIANVMLSIDGFGDVFTYQRHGGNWDDVLNNIYTFNDVIDRSKVYLTNNYTVTCFTLLSVVDFIKQYNHLFDGQRFEPIAAPEMYQINLIKPEYIMRFLNDLDDLIDELDDDVIKNLRIAHLYHECEKALINPPSRKVVDKLWDRINYFDKHRGKLAEMIPEAMEYLQR